MYSLTCPATNTKINAIINNSKTNRNAFESHQMSVPTRNIYTSMKYAVRTIYGHTITDSVFFSYRCFYVVEFNMSVVSATALLAIVGSPVFSSVKDISNFLLHWRMKLLIFAIQVGTADL